MESTRKKTCGLPFNADVERSLQPTARRMAVHFYGIFCYMVLVMLLNLLIAMMGDTCALDHQTASPGVPQTARVV